MMLLLDYIVKIVYTNSKIHLNRRMAMIEATSCGGVVIFRGKILLLYKNYKGKYEGWVLPKGTVEEGEEYKDTALREVLEESGAKAMIMKYVGKTRLILKPLTIRFLCISRCFVWLPRIRRW